jgi:gliding motility-associated-like protein
MRYLFIYLGLMLSTCSIAQQGPFFLSKLSFKDTSFYESGRVAFIEDGNGNYYMAAVRKLSFTIYREISITKMDANRQTIWSKRYFDASNSGNPQEVFLQALNDGNFMLVWGSDVAAGYFKFKPDGSLLWSKRFSGVQKSQILAIQPFQDDLVMVGHKDDNPFVCRIRSDGTVKWATTIPDSTLSFFHKSRFEGLWVDSTGGVVACGYLSPTIDITNLLSYFAKFDKDGNLIWGKRYQQGWLKFVRPMPDGQWILGGNLDGINSGAWLLKTITSGEIIWSKRVNYAFGTVVGLNGLLTDSNYLIQPAFNNSLLGLDHRGQSICNFDTSGQFLQGYLQKQDSSKVYVFSMRYDSQKNILMALTQKGNPNNIRFGRFTATGDLPGCCLDKEFLITEELPPTISDYKPPVISGISTYNFPLLPYEIKPTIEQICEYQPVDVSFQLTDTLLCPGECVSITLNNPDLKIPFHWITADGSPVTQETDQTFSACFKLPGTKIIELVAMDGCLVFKHTDTVRVSTQNERTPNAFTPNGDGANDTFAPISQCNFSTYHFSIFDRWGTKVFDTTDPTEKWDGKINGQDAPMDVFAWVVTYGLIQDGVLATFNNAGSVSLLR